MTNPVIKLANIRGQTGRNMWLWCPACEDTHMIVVEHPEGWTWDGNEEFPTLSPSLLVRGHQWAMEYGFHKRRHLVEPGQPTICHSFVRAGQWQFLNDCTHELAGQIIPMVPVPDWLVRNV